MTKTVYFDADPANKGVLRFVENYRKGGFLRKERIEYSIEGGEYFPLVEDLSAVYARISKDFDNALIWDGSPSEIEEKLRDHRFWLIVKECEDGEIEYFSNITCGKVQWTDDLQDADISLDEKSASDCASAIRRIDGGKVRVMPVFLNIVNRLLTPIFMIVCQSKKSGIKKYFARHEEGNRIRLVKLSNSARRMTYSDAIGMFEFLKARNKAFFYMVLPVFKDNVGCKDIDSYVSEKRIPRLIEMSTKLKWLNK